jgi:hypothetical protein
MLRRRDLTTSIFLAIALAACAQTMALSTKKPLVRPRLAVRALLMPPDIELSELTAGGLLQPKADWTREATAHVTTALRDELRMRNMDLVLYREPTDDPAAQHADSQIIKLHDAVGHTIFVHKQIPSMQLPTKEDKFDWSPGRDFKDLRAMTRTTRSSSL